MRVSLIRHAQWWSENPNVLDELEQLADAYIAQIPTGAANTLDGLEREWRRLEAHARHAQQEARQAQAAVREFQAHEQAQERWAAAWPEGGDEMRPSTLLQHAREAERLRQLGPDEEFRGLDAVADAPADGEYSLRVLRSKHQVAHVAESLRNCARAYIDRCREGRYLLVALYRGEAPVALAGYDAARGGEAWDHPPVASSNRNATLDVQARFDAYLSTLRVTLVPTYLRRSS